MTLDVSLLPQVALLFMLLFARIGTMMMLMPALGEGSIVGDCQSRYPKHVV